jgi:hypothetical protein
MGSSATVVMSATPTTLPLVSCRRRGAALGLDRPYEPGSQKQPDREAPEPPRW